MRNITLSADERLIEAARGRARAEKTTINEQFRRWLAEYAERDARDERAERAECAMRLIEAMQRTVSTGGRKFTREEMNER